jgi:uncharacterized protein (TIGR02301 family)
VAAGLATVFVAAGPTGSGNPPPRAPTQTSAIPATPKETAPYDDQYLRLAEILGALHHLRPLCGADEAQTWRNQMATLIEAEQPAPDRRRRLVDAFNRSWRGVVEIHRTCSPVARELAQRLTEEGTRLTREVVARWGNR